MTSTYFACRCEVAEKLESASTLATKGDIPGARDLLTKLRGRIRESVVFRRPLGVHLVETVDESLGGLQDKVCVYAVESRETYSCRRFVNRSIIQRQCIELFISLSRLPTTGMERL